MKARILSFAITLLVLLNFENAFSQQKSAQQPHFNDPPITTDKGTTLEQCGDIYGLAAGVTYTVTISAPATVTTECTNHGGNVAPGQTKTVTASASGEYTADRNGHVHYCLETDEPSPGRCPNGNWTGDVTEVSFGTVTTSVNGRPIRIVGNNKR